MSSDTAADTDFRAWLNAGERRRAAEWLVHQYADAVMGLCTAMVPDRTTAEDLAQDVYGRAFAGLAQFRGEASARTWILKIARNRCIDHLRAQERDPWGAAAPDPREPDTHPDEAPLPPDLILRRDDVEDALTELAEGDRALVVLRFRHGLDYAELATAFGIKKGTVRMRVSRALARMRRALEAKNDAAKREGQPIQAMTGQIAAAVLVDDALDAVEGDTAPLDEAPALRASRPAPARRSAFAPGAKPARAPRLWRQIAGTLRREPLTPPRPPIDHPLTVFFAATRQPPSNTFQTQLIAQAQSI